ncbi:MAG TPA: phage tail tape measure protein [Clostridiales bacterium]|nr:MAG: phage tail tape measure protein [Clostridiales bacterium GWD2_32_19]HCC07272.1 phage tail tape measure protein [Clostridiales bacterium]
MGKNLDLSLFAGIKMDGEQIKTELARFNNKIDLKILASIENIEKVKSQLEQISGKKINIADLNGIKSVQTQINNLTQQYDKLDNKTKNIVARNRQWHMSLADLVRRYMSVYAIIQAINNAKDYVLNVDKAIISLQKVTNETDETYRKFLETSNKVAISLGKTSAEVINATASFSKLGYSFKDAQELGKEALLYSNIGDIDVETATDNIVATLKGFNLEASETRRVIDSINEVSNKFSISASDVGQALKRSSASMNQANNTLEETIGLYTAGVEILQDPAKVSNALKTISMRIRGIALDGEEAIPKVRELVKSLSGVEIMESADKFKSTYQVMNELSKVWGDLTDKKRASLLEVIGGKQNAATAAAVLQNMTNGVKAYETALNSSGSAIKEQERYMQGLEAKIAQVNEKWLNSVSDIVNSELIKWILDGTGGFLDFTKEIGTTNSALIALGATLSIFGGGIGLVLGAVVGLTGGLLALASAMDNTLGERTVALDKQMENTNETIKEMEAIYKLAEEYKNLTNNVDDNISSKGGLKKAEDALISKFPELTGLIYDQTNALDENRKAIENNITRLNQLLKQGAEKALFDLNLDTTDISKMINEQTRLANSSEKMAQKIKENLQGNIDYDELYGVGFNVVAKTYGATSKERIEFEKQFNDAGKTLWGKGLTEEEIKQKTRDMYRYFDGVNQESTQKVQEYFAKLGDIAELENMIKEYNTTGKLPELPKTEETKKKVVTDYVYNEYPSTTSGVTVQKEEELKILDRYYDINNKISEQQSKIQRLKLDTELIDEKDYNKRIESINKEIEETKRLQASLHELNEQRRAEKVGIEDNISVLSKLNKPTITQKNEIVELKERLADLNKTLDETSNQYMSNEVAIKSLIDKQIDLTEEIKKAQEELNKTVHSNIEKYQKYLSEQVKDRIDDLKKERQVIEDKYDVQLDKLEKEYNLTKQVNEENNRALEINKAKQQLENIKKEKNIRIYDDSQGWIWTHNGKEALSTEENLEGLLQQQKEYDDEKAFEKAKARIEEEKQNKLNAFDEELEAAEKYYDKMEKLFENHNEDIITYNQLISSIPLEWQQANLDSIGAIQNMTIQSEKLIDKLNEVKKLSSSLNVSSNSITVGGSFANGGVNDFTGLAMLHGTPNKPEFVFNNDQMKTFISNMMSGKGNTNDNRTVNYNFSGDIVTPNVTEFMIKMNNLVKTS